jgi:hypothetical protein
VEEDLVPGRLEESRAVDEGDVDPARVTGVGTDDGVVASRQPRVEGADEEIDDEAVLDFADPEQVRAGPAVICAITEASWATLRSRRAGVQPARSAPIARWSFSLRRGEFSSSKRLSRFHQAT